MLPKIAIFFLLFCLASADQKEVRNEPSGCEHEGKQLDDGAIAVRAFIPYGRCWEKRCERSVMRKRVYPCGPPSAAALNTQFVGHIRGKRSVRRHLLHLLPSATLQKQMSRGRVTRTISCENKNEQCEPLSQYITVLFCFCFVSLQAS